MANKRLTQEDVLGRIRKVHGDKYDLSHVEYSGAKSKLKLMCPDHGVFQVLLGNVESGQGCPACNNLHRYSTEEAIDKLTMVRGTRYDYSKVVYENSYTPLEIVCKEHGSFWQSFHNHLKGADCTACTGHRRKTTDEFVQQATALHKGFYDYSLVEYKNKTQAVTIICPAHGEFRQSPSKHLEGCGCKKCAKNGFDPFSSATFYLMACGDSTALFTGYGITKDLKTRLSCHKTNLKKQAFTITQQLTYAFPLGSYAKELEDMLYAEYPDVSNIGSSVPGFKRESTDAPFEQVKEFIEQKIKENSQKWELLE